MNNIKFIIIGILLSIVTISTYILFTISYDREDYIKVKKIPNYTDIRDTLKNDISKIKNEECKNSLNNMLSRIESTYYTKDITVEEYYLNYNKDDNTFLNMFEEAKDACSLTNEQSDPIYILALSSTNYPNKIKEKYLYSYELKIKDKFSRKEVEDINDEIGTYTTKMLEFKTLKEIINEVKK